MTLMLELSKELKITIINMLKVITEKVNNMNEKIGNFSREKFWELNGMVEIKNVVTETKNAFYGLTSRHKIVKSQWIWWQVDRNYPNWNTKKKKKRVEKNQKKAFKICRIQSEITIIRIPGKKKVHPCSLQPLFTITKR